MRTINVYCGSSSGENKIYGEVAKEFGALLARENIRIIFGGGKVGLMGALADGALENGGEVIGVIPEFLMHKEIAHAGISEMIVVNNMFERKEKMLAMSDAFVAMPGGYGTIDELFEVLTTLQLARHEKPIGILNINGYYNHMLTFMKNMVDEKFVQDKHLEMIAVSDQPAELLKLLRAFEAPEIDKWFR